MRKVGIYCTVLVPPGNRIRDILNISIEVALEFIPQVS
jgi:hypothetical protein